MFRLLIAASLRIRHFLRCYMPPTSSPTKSAPGPATNGVLWRCCWPFHTSPPPYGSQALSIRAHPAGCTCSYCWLPGMGSRCSGSDPSVSSGSSAPASMRPSNSADSDVPRGGLMRRPNGPQRSQREWPDAATFVYTRCARHNPTQFTSHTSKGRAQRTS